MCSVSPVPHTDHVRPGRQRTRCALADGLLSWDLTIGAGQVAITTPMNTRPFPAAPGIPRGGAPAQLQRRGARARRLAVGGEPGGATARGAAARGAAGAHDAQRVADGCGKAPRGGSRPRRSAQAVAALTEVSAQPGEAVGRLRLSVPRDGGALRHRSGAAHVSRASPAGRGRGRRRGPLRGHRGGGLRRRRAAQRVHRARHGAACGSPSRSASWWWARPSTSRATERPKRRGSPPPRVHHVPLADHGRALRVGAGAGTQEPGACRFAAASSRTTAG